MSSGGGMRDFDYRDFQDTRTFREELQMKTRSGGPDRVEVRISAPDSGDVLSPIAAHDLIHLVLQLEFLFLEGDFFELLGL